MFRLTVVYFDLCIDNFLVTLTAISRKTERSKLHFSVEHERLMAYLHG